MDITAISNAPDNEIISFSFPGVALVGCAFTTTKAGNMGMVLEPGTEAAVADNRHRLLETLGLERWVELKQVHGDALLADPQPTDIKSASSLTADGAATRQKGLALAVKTADCQPLLLSDKRGRAVAALHVGWRGNALAFPVTGVIRFCSIYNIDPSEVLAVRGPSLGPSAAQFTNFEQEWPARYRPWFDEASKTMDLWELTKFQLIEAGMLPDNIHSLDLCTYSRSDLFFSHRRGHSGRQVSLIWIKEH
ncbi:polyphenol oxidase family protein [Desulfovibrio sp. OttesenSCG-928-M16]|nr:polyphenol oxidase family protein [Desulfovibrio sp. OttesenSCG-928-M16]